MNRTSPILLPPVVLWTSLVLAGIHAARQLWDQDLDRWLLLALAFIPARYGEAADFLPGGYAARFWSPVTYAFIHADIVHLLVNVVWMASFGSALARRWGSMRFLLLAAVSAAAGAGLHFAFVPSDQALVVGASGAVSGMMAGTARFAFAPHGPLGGSPPRSYSVPAEPLLRALSNTKVLAFLGVWFIANLIFGLAGGMILGASGPIAWQAHIGGFVAGLVLFGLLDPVGSDPEAGKSLA